MAGRDDTPIGEPDDVAVTDVSKEVLEELSVLFGDTPPTAKETDSPLNSEDGSTTNVVPFATKDPSTRDISDPIPDNVIVIGDSDESDRTPAPSDPLLGSLARSGDDVVETIDDGGTVVIDADTMDRVVIVDDDRPDPTFEERQRRHKRRERLRRVKWVKLAGVVVAAIVVIAGVLASPLFAIRRVAFEGVVYTSKETVEKVTESIKGSSIFTVDTAQAREQLLDDPWVAEVRITTDFPGKALVEVAERVPVVWYVGEVLRVVESLAAQGMTMMMVTHEMAFARKVADRIVFMHAGRIHEMGPPSAVFGDPQTPELRQFLSSLVN